MFALCAVMVKPGSIGPGFRDSVEGLCTRTNEKSRPERARHAALRKTPSNGREISRKAAIGGTEQTAPSAPLIPSNSVTSKAAIRDFCVCVNLYIPLLQDSANG